MNHDEENIAFEHDDLDELEIDTSDVETEGCFLNYDSRIMKEKNALMEFLDKNTELKREKGTDEVNIFNIRGSYYCFKTETNKDKSLLTKFFNKLEECRRKGITLMFCEKQNPNASGIMLDFDFKKDENLTKIIPAHTKQRLIKHIIRIMKDVLDLDNYLLQHKYITVVVIKNPKKPNFHLIIPGIMISRSAKRFLVHKILESKIIDDIFSNTGMLEPNILDYMSSHVPINFLGNTRNNKKTDAFGGKKIKPPYILESVWEIRIDDKDISILPDNELLSNKNPKANLCFEFSINFERPKNCMIAKRKIDINSKIEHEFTLFTEKVGNSKEVLDEYEKVENMLSILKEVDPDIEYTRKLISILAPYRSQEYMPWMQVVNALACMGEEYKPICIEFNLKCPEKRDRVAFENLWNNSRKIRFYADPSRALGKLQSWAKQDNISKYNDIKKFNIHSYIMKEIYGPINEGCLRHAQIAKILRKIVKNKFVVDTPKNEKRHVWYEFILSEAEAKNGEIFKWRKITDSSSGNPLSLEKYISTNLLNVFEKIYNNIKNKNMRKPNGANKEQIKQYEAHDALIVRNFKRTCGNLSNYGFIKSCIDMSRSYFNIPGFADGMDKNGMIMGVGNGVLEFYENGFVKHIKEYHSHKISKYTTVHYKPLDFDDPMVIYILKIIRNMFADDKVESFNWFMHYLGTTMDGNPKEQFMLLMYGQGNNGKSLITSLLESILGDDYSHTLNSTLLTASSRTAESATPELMKVHQRRCIKFSEVNLSVCLNIQTLKRILGGELISGRKLNEDTMQFLPACIYLLLLNALLEIPTHEEATWKRLKLLILQFRFYPENHHMYDKNNKCHKLGDKDAKKILSTVEAKEAFLSILVFYWQSLQVNYGGNINNVPHEYIIRDTMEYRNKQDTLSCFVNSRMVKTKKDYIIYMSDIGNLYSSWYETKYRRKCRLSLSTLEESLKNSKIQSMFKKDARFGLYLKGARFLGPSEELKEGESYVFGTEKKKREEENVFVSSIHGDTSETVDETINNIKMQHKSLLERIKNPDYVMMSSEEDIKERELRRKQEMKKNTEIFKEARKRSYFRCNNRRPEKIKHDDYEEESDVDEKSEGENSDNSDTSSDESENDRDNISSDTESSDSE